MIATLNGSTRSHEIRLHRLKVQTLRVPQVSGSLAFLRSNAYAGLLARTVFALTLALAALAGCQTAPHDASAPPEPSGTAPRPEPEVPLARSPGPASESPGAVPAGLDLWAAIRGDFRLDHEIDQPLVRAELDKLRRYPGELAKMGERLELYLPYVYAEVKARGMPAEIALLPILESSMNPHAQAVGGPAGMWQLIPATGDRMHLPRNWWYDGRRDPTLSTRAALDYLAYMHSQFDDWSLAIVSYNTGEGTVLRAMGGRTGPVSVWSLRLPHHGMVFVPKLFALAELVDHPERYGVTLPQLRTGPTFTTLDTGGQVDIAAAAAALGIDSETLYLLNPALNRTATPPDGPHQLNVPPTFADQARTWLAGLDHSERPVQWDRIEVRSGDSLSTLANRYGTDVRTLRQINKLSDDRLRAGQALFVPTASTPGHPSGALATASAPRPATASPHAGVGGRGPHVVRTGDTLWGIARSYRISVDKLVAANRLKSGQVLKIGQRLVIPAG